jgi:hypothetical protein
VIQETGGHELVSFLKSGNSRRNSHVHVFSITTYASPGRAKKERIHATFFPCNRE